MHGGFTRRAISKEFGAQHPSCVWELRSVQGILIPSRGFFYAASPRLSRLHHSHPLLVVSV